jgi:hypothetical protein
MMQRRLNKQLCAPCSRAANDPYYRFAIHLVHPEHGKRMVFDVRGEAVCPDCHTRWRATRRNTAEIVNSAYSKRHKSNPLERAALPKENDSNNSPHGALWAGNSMLAEIQDAGAGH